MRGRLLLVLALAGSGCASSPPSTRPAFEIVDPGVGPESELALDPLGDGCVQIDRVSGDLVRQDFTSVVAGTIAVDGRTALRLVSPTETKLIERTAEGDFWLGSPPTVPLFARPVLVLPPKLREGMAWRVFTDDSDTPRFEFRVRLRTVLDTPIGRRTAWAVERRDGGITVGDHVYLEGVGALAAVAVSPANVADVEAQVFKSPFPTLCPLSAERAPPAPLIEVEELAVSDLPPHASWVSAVRGRDGSLQLMIKGGDPALRPRDRFFEWYWEPRDVCFTFAPDGKVKGDCPVFDATVGFATDVGAPLLTLQQAQKGVARTIGAYEAAGGVRKIVRKADGRLLIEGGAAPVALYPDPFVRAPLFAPHALGPWSSYWLPSPDGFTLALRTPDGHLVHQRYEEPRGATVPKLQALLSRPSYRGGHLPELLSLGTDGVVDRVVVGVDGLSIEHLGRVALPSPQGLVAAFRGDERTLYVVAEDREDGLPPPQDGADAPAPARPGRLRLLRGRLPAPTAVPFAERRAVVATPHGGDLVVCGPPDASYAPPERSTVMFGGAPPAAVIPFAGNECVLFLRDVAAARSPVTNDAFMLEGSLPWHGRAVYVAPGLSAMASPIASPVAPFGATASWAALRDGGLVDERALFDAGMILRRESQVPTNGASSLADLRGAGLFTQLDAGSYVLRGADDRRFVVEGGGAPVGWGEEGGVVVEQMRAGVAAYAFVSGELIASELPSREELGGVPVLRRADGSLLVHTADALVLRASGAAPLSVPVRAAKVWPVAGGAVLLLDSDRGALSLLDLATMSLRDAGRDRSWEPAGWSPEGELYLLRREPSVAVARASASGLVDVPLPALDRYVYVTPAKSPTALFVDRDTLMVRYPGSPAPVRLPRPR